MGKLRKNESKGYENTKIILLIFPFPEGPVRTYIDSEKSGAPPPNKRKIAKPLPKFPPPPPSLKKWVHFVGCCVGCLGTTFEDPKMSITNRKRCPERVPFRVQKKTWKNTYF